MLQEAKDSSEVENIVTTHEEVFKEAIGISTLKNIAAKEVRNYAQTLRQGFRNVHDSGFLSLNHILEVQQRLERNKAGMRKVSGTTLKNQQAGETVYVPPQSHVAVKELMANLEDYINNGNELDPLVAMAIIHYQFESIHPFYDGNGRTGRILNILYLVLKGLLDLPVLYHSRYIIKNKESYYLCLQNVRDKNDWESMVLFMLEAVEETSREGIALVNDITALMARQKEEIRKQEPRVYSKDLLENIFRHPYTTIPFLMSDLQVSRITATSYLNKLVEIGLLRKDKISNKNFYLNVELFNLFLHVGEK